MRNLRKDGHYARVQFPLGLLTMPLTTVANPDHFMAYQCTQGVPEGSVCIEVAMTHDPIDLQPMLTLIFEHPTFPVVPHRHDIPELVPVFRSFPVHTEDD